MVSFVELFNTTTEGKVLPKLTEYENYVILAYKEDVDTQLIKSCTISKLWAQRSIHNSRFIASTLSCSYRCMCMVMCEVGKKHGL